MIVNYIGQLFFLSLCLAITSANINISNSETQNKSSAPLAVTQLKDHEKEYKLNKKGERLLNRKITLTNLNVIANNSDVSKTNESPALRIVTEGSGVSRININKDINNSTLVIAGAGRTSTKIPITTTTQVPLAINANATKVKPHLNETGKIDVSNIAKIPPVPQNNSSIIVKSSPSQTTTTTTTSTTTTTTTTTTPKPKKPKVTYSVEDMPDIAKIIPDRSSSNSKFPSETKSSAPKLSVDEPEQPIAQPSQEFNGGLYRNHRDYIIPIVSIIFAVPILMGMVIVAYRRFRDFWSTRHYRRMDFLVDGMYND